MSNPKKAWERPVLRTEQVEETLARPACRFKSPSNVIPRRPQIPRPVGPAFS